MLYLRSGKTTEIFRSSVLLLLTLSAGLAVPFALSATEPQEEVDSGLARFDVESDTAGAVTADLKDRLEKDLRARRPVEFEFIAEVVLLVEKDELPLSLVNRCYLWARRKSTFPFQYFQRAVQVEAKKIGVDI